jgi:diguanylate cyclase (GGDEF)-like protein
MEIFWVFVVFRRNRDVRNMRWRTPGSPEPDISTPEREGSPARDLAGYRSRIARLLTWLGLVVGLAILVPASVIELRQGWSLIAAVDLGAIVSLALVAVVGERFRKVGPVGLVLIVFCLGAFMLLGNGSDYIGASWLSSAIVLSGILFGTGGAFVLAALSTAVFVVAFIPAHLGALAGLSNGPGLHFLALNTIALSLACALAVSRLIRYLDQSTAATQRLDSELRLSESARKEEVAERKGAEALAAFYRDYDVLTHLPRRGKLADAASAAMSQAERRDRLVAVLSIGIERFSRIADSYGTAASEAFILQVSSALRSTFREYDTVARLGEDSFGILCADLGKPEDVSGLIEKARRCLDTPFCVGDLRLKPVASLGLALYPGDAADAEGLIRSSEAALRSARLSEPGSYCLFDASLNAEVVSRFKLEDELEAALFMGSIVPWFQPKVDSAGRIIGAEALARWILPDGGVRMPSSFIPAAEGSGGIVALGKVVLASACSLAARWASRGLPAIPVSVNLSPHQFRSPSLVDDVRRALRESGLEPSRLDLEITESGMAIDEDDVIGRLAELKALGITLSIDDFGTGASTISRLRDYPVDTVKVPKAFVDPLPGDSRASMIARAVIDLAHNLEFDVVAEGVEDAAQFDWLRGQACDQFQGFLFSPALPADEFEGALARGCGAIVQ